MSALEDDRPGSGTLVLLLHALKTGASGLDSLCSAIQCEWPAAQLLRPQLPLSPITTADPSELVTGLLSLVDTAASKAQAAGAPVRNIVLVGHSFGALLARMLYVAACGEVTGAPPAAEEDPGPRRSAPAWRALPVGCAEAEMRRTTGAQAGAPLTGQAHVRTPRAAPAPSASRDPERALLAFAGLMPRALRRNLRRQADRLTGRSW